MIDLIKLLRMTQNELKFHLFEILKNKEYKPVNEKGFLFAEGEIPVLLVAHMDTVSDTPPKAVFYQTKKDKLFNPNGILGGDDRCGVYAILKLLEKYKPYVLFTEDEEIGCVGAGIAATKIKNLNVKYIIEFDRKGKDDCVFYQCGNQEFIKYVESFGFKKNYGTCSDISIIGKEWNIASVNLSSGYYKEHTANEYIIFGELEETIRRADKMVNAIDEAKYFDYHEEMPYQYSGGTYGDSAYNPYPAYAAKDNGTSCGTGFQFSKPLPQDVPSQNKWDATRRDNIHYSGAIYPQDMGYQGRKRWFDIGDDYFYHDDLSPFYDYHFQWRFSIKKLSLKRVFSWFTGGKKHE